MQVVVGEELVPQEALALKALEALVEVETGERAMLRLVGAP